MSVRVVARIRPLLSKESEKDIILSAAASQSNSSPNPIVVSIPNPKNEAELFSFQFNSVYDRDASQQEIFDNEVSPTVKHLFNGFDVTLFAYGVTGTGKTHTMRGGRSLADRGVIPRLLSSIYRRGRKVEKDSSGATTVQVAMSYYEIYNDRVYDLFEPPDKRTAAGLPIRDHNGKTVVVGLTERPCSTLKEFEQLYDQANVNRSTSATKLNAHSSRSHAILCVKLTQSTGDQVLISNASAIDLAGSEDNRRTDNNKDRLVESASINKSLFVLAQCVEAISKKQSRIPYRESKMTRILSLGQNNGLTVMILNLAPVRSYHLDTLSSLNFANRTKRIEVNEIENEPIFAGTVATKPTISLGGGPALNRQPLRQLAPNTHMAPQPRRTDKPVKAFSVYTDKRRSGERPSSRSSRPSAGQKRPFDHSLSSSISRPAKALRPTGTLFSSNKPPEPTYTKSEIEALIERRIDAKIAERALSEKVQPAEAISAELQARLTSLELRVAERQNGSSSAETTEGLQYLLMAKQHQARGEDTSALKMFEIAKPWFPGNEKLERKIEGLRERIRLKRAEEGFTGVEKGEPVIDGVRKPKGTRDDEDYRDGAANQEADDSFAYKPTRKQPPKTKVGVFRDNGATFHGDPLSPRTQQLLDIINTRDLMQIKLLRGVGSKKAEAIVSSLCDMDEDEKASPVTNLEQLGALKGVGWKTVENMRLGLGVS